jgi:hypothetical protein
LEEGGFNLLIQKVVRSNAGGNGKEQDTKHGVQSTHAERESTFLSVHKEGCVLAHEDIVPSKEIHLKPSVCSVREVLKQKRTASKEFGTEAVHNSNSPPPLIPGLNVTAEEVESTARKLQSGAGPRGGNAEAWQDWLLRFGEHSAELREAVAVLNVDECLLILSLGNN